MEQRRTPKATGPAPTTHKPSISTKPVSGGFSPEANQSGPPQPNTSAFAEFKKWNDACLSHGSQIMDGMTLDIHLWERLLPLAVAAGNVKKSVADKVLHGIKFGFDLGADESKMGPAKVRKNYASAMQNSQLVTDALAKRVKKGKTLKLGPWKPSDGLPTGTERGCNVPQGAVPKKLEKHLVRDISDHTKTHFNNCLDMSDLSHTLNTYAEIEQALRPSYSMRVEDVDGAFPVLPLAPRIWKYMYVIWYDIDIPLTEQKSPNTIYVHTFADFGTAAMPGVWDMFWRCVKAMAKTEGILTHPMPHYVDDNSLIGPDAEKIDAEAELLSAFLVKLGCPFKALKSRKAAMVQLVLGFWWDSVNRTRSLESEKLDSYLQHLREASSARVLTLKDLQVLAGRMQRASMTMPPRAIVYLSNLLAMMSGLKYPWHQRRITAAVRHDLKMLISALEVNQGRGYFCFEHFGRAPAVYTDSSKNGRYTGGGYFSECGAYDYWKFGSSASRQPIDYLEGAAVLKAAQDLGPGWKNKIVPIHIDNSSFCCSLKKGRSKAPRLNNLLEKLFLLSVQYDCVFEPHWISTHDNIAADALSRDDEKGFRVFVHQHFKGSIDIFRFNR